MQGTRLFTFFHALMSEDDEEMDKFPQCADCMNKDFDPFQCQDCENASNFEPYEPEEEDDIEDMTIDEFKEFWRNAL